MSKTIAKSKNMREALTALGIGCFLALLVFASTAAASFFEIAAAAFLVVGFAAIAAGAGLLCVSQVVAALHLPIFLLPPAVAFFATVSVLLSRIFAPAAPPPRGALSA